MNDFEKYFFATGNKKCRIHKWHHYFSIYDSHMSRFRDKKPVIVEVGVYGGGSLEMWNNYFGGNARSTELMSIDPVSRRLAS